MMRGLFGKVSQHLDVDTYFNYLVDETGNGLRLVSSAGVPEPHGAALQRLQFGESICGTVARQRTPIVVTRVQQSDAANVQLIKSLGIRAYACNPLLADDRLIGTLSFASRTKDAFSSDEIEFLQTLSHYVTIAHERLRLVERLRVADRRKDEFLATLAHELRNPLAPVRNAAELLRRADGNKDLVAQGVTILRSTAVAHGALDRRPDGRGPHHHRQVRVTQDARRAGRHFDERRGSEPAIDRDDGP